MRIVAGMGAVLGTEHVEGVPVAAIIVAIVLIAVNGAFVAAEFALLASMRTRIEPLAEDGRMTGRAALLAMGRLGPMLAGTQLGITICSLALGSVTEPAVAGALESLFGRFDWPDTLSTVVAVVIALSIVVFLHLLFGEMVPRSIALAAPERALLALSVPVGAFVAVFRPLIWFLNLLARLGARLFGVEPSDELRSAATSAELSIMLEESAEVGLLEDDEVVLLTSALSFVERRVSEIMVPSSRMVTVPSDATVADIERVVVESGHTRILLVGGANGSSARRRGGSSAAVGARAVAGFVHAKDLLRMAPEQRDRPVPIRPRSLMAVPEEITLPALLVDMRARRAHLAVVIDDHGATVGMVTMEDVLECIVGDIRDESDRLVERLDEQSDDEADEGGARRGDR